ncbi:hypothetical protein ACWT_1506 [Actinoplanes sp. SE50]|nr:hypothetical protein ACPL_1628 [Actinoplanes sp. SE50/110]ATO80921.1 hypothetical protein ACWT_1506 [Actinoplanes sp. SE50]SLL98328.1 hypothetical protein ACSP50_1554 [Actinoplanes sp. SE50/110]
MPRRDRRLIGTPGHPPGPDRTLPRLGIGPPTRLSEFLVGSSARLSESPVGPHARLPGPLIGPHAGLPGSLVGPDTMLSRSLAGAPGSLSGPVRVHRCRRHRRLRWRHPDRLCRGPGRRRAVPFLRHRSKVERPLRRPPAASRERLGRRGTRAAVGRRHGPRPVSGPPGLGHRPSSGTEPGFVFGPRRIRLGPTEPLLRLTGLLLRLTGLLRPTCLRRRHGPAGVRRHRPAGPLRPARPRPATGHLRPTTSRPRLLPSAVLPASVLPRVLRTEIAGLTRRAGKAGKAGRAGRAGETGPVGNAGNIRGTRPAGPIGAPSRTRRSLPPERVPTPLLLLRLPTPALLPPLPGLRHPSRPGPPRRHRRRPPRRHRRRGSGSSPGRHRHRRRGSPPVHPTLRFPAVRPVPRRVVARVAGATRVPLRFLVRGPPVSVRRGTAGTGDARRRLSAVGFVDRCVHGFAPPRVTGIALSGKRLPLPGDLVHPRRFVVPAVRARAGAPTVHRATGPGDWQRSVTANSNV